MGGGGFWIGTPGLEHAGQALYQRAALSLIFMLVLNKMLELHRVILIFSAIPFKTLTMLFCRNRNTHPEIHIESPGVLKTKMSLKKKRMRRYTVLSSKVNTSYRNQNNVLLV
jgi:hypothetical protein